MKAAHINQDVSDCHNFTTETNNIVTGDFSVKSSREFEILREKIDGISENNKTNLKSSHVAGDETGEFEKNHDVDSKFKFKEDENIVKQSCRVYKFFTTSETEKCGTEKIHTATKKQLSVINMRVILMKVHPTVFVASKWKLIQIKKVNH